MFFKTIALLTCLCFVCQEIALAATMPENSHLRQMQFIDRSTAPSKAAANGALENFTAELNHLLCPEDASSDKIKELNTLRIIERQALLSKLEKLLDDNTRDERLTLREARQYGAGGLIEWLNQPWQRDEQAAITAYLEAVEIPNFVLAVRVAQTSYMYPIYESMKAQHNTDMQFYERFHGGAGLFYLLQAPLDINARKPPAGIQNSFGPELPGYSHMTQLKGRYIPQQSPVETLFSRLCGHKNGVIRSPIIGYDGFLSVHINFLGAELKGEDFVRLTQTKIQVIDQMSSTIMLLVETNGNILADTQAPNQGAPFYLTFAINSKKGVTDGLNTAIFSSGQISADTSFPFRPYGIFASDDGVVIFPVIASENAIFDADLIYDCIVGDVDLPEFLGRRGLTQDTWHPFSRVVYSNLARIMIPVSERREWDNLRIWRWSDDKICADLYAMNVSASHRLLTSYINARHRITAFTGKEYYNISTTATTEEYFAAALLGIFGPQPDSVFSTIERERQENGQKGADEHYQRILIALFSNTFLPLFHARCESQEQEQAHKYAAEALCALWASLSKVDENGITIDMNKWQQAQSTVWHDICGLTTMDEASVISFTNRLIDAQQTGTEFTKIQRTANVFFKGEPWEFLATHFELAMKMSAWTMLGILTGSVGKKHQSQVTANERILHFNDCPIPMDSLEWQRCIALLEKFGYSKRNTQGLDLLALFTYESLAMFYEPQLSPGEGRLFSDDGLERIALLSGGVPMELAALNDETAIPKDTLDSKGNGYLRMPRAIFVTQTDEDNNMILNPETASTFYLGDCGFNPGERVFLIASNDTVSIYRKTDNGYVEASGIHRRDLTDISDPHTTTPTHLEKEGHKVWVSPNFTGLGIGRLDLQKSQACVWRDGFESKKTPEICTVDGLVKAGANDNNIDGFAPLKIGDDGLLYIGSQLNSAYRFTDLGPNHLNLSSKDTVLFRSRHHPDKFYVFCDGTSVLEDDISALREFYPYCRFTNGAERLPLYYGNNGKLLLHSLSQEQRDKAITLLQGLGAEDAIDGIRPGTNLKIDEIDQPRNSIRENEIILPSAWLNQPITSEIVYALRQLFINAQDPVDKARRLLSAYKEARSLIDAIGAKNGLQKILQSKEITDAAELLAVVDQNPESADFANDSHRQEFKTALSEIENIKQYCEKRIEEITNNRLVIENIVEETVRQATVEKIEIDTKELTKTLTAVLAAPESRNILMARKGSAKLKLNELYAEKSLVAGIIDDRLLKPSGLTIAIKTDIEIDTAIAEPGKPVILVAIPKMIEAISRETRAKRTEVNGHLCLAFNMQGEHVTELYCSFAEVEQFANEIGITDNETIQALHQRFQEAETPAMKTTELTKKMAPIMPGLIARLRDDLEFCFANAPDPQPYADYSSSASAKLALINIAMDYCLQYLGSKKSLAEALENDEDAQVTAVTARQKRNNGIPIEPLNNILDRSAEFLDEFQESTGQMPIEQLSLFFSSVLPIAISHCGNDVISHVSGEIVKAQLSNYYAIAEHAVTVDANNETIYIPAHWQSLTDEEVKVLVGFFKSGLSATERHALNNYHIEVLYGEHLSAVTEELTEAVPVSTSLQSATVVAKPAPIKHRYESLPDHYIIPLGGAEEIGASSYLLVMANRCVLVDIGARMHNRGSNGRLPDFDTLRKVLTNRKLDAVILTHAHYDHIGALPVLIRKLNEWGMEIPPVYATSTTRDFTKEVLLDSLKVMRSEIPENVLYQEPQIDGAISNIQVLDENTWYSISDDLKLYLNHAGHMLGAVSPVLVDRNVSIMMTGDISFEDRGTVAGADKPPLAHIDTLISEATYGTRLSHDNSYSAEIARLGQCIKSRVGDVFNEPGAILIPAFSHRAADILIAISSLMNGSAGRNGYAIPTTTQIYVDGALTQKMIQIARNRIGRNEANLLSPVTSDGRVRYELIKTPQERAVLAEKLKTDADTPIIVIASSGMCNGGPSQRYLNAILHSKNTKRWIFTVGFSEDGSPAGMLRDMGYRALEEFHFSGHSAADGIIGLAKRIQPDSIVLVHGEKNALYRLSGSIGLRSAISKGGSIKIGSNSRQWNFVVDVNRQAVFDIIQSENIANASGNSSKQIYQSL